MENFISQQQQFLDDRKAEEAKFKPSHFSFDVPARCIALSSNTFRDECKLMVVSRSTGQISHHTFNEIFTFFDRDDVVIFNSSTVIPSTVEALKVVGADSAQEGPLKIQVTFLNNQGGGMYEVRVNNPRRVREGNVLYFGDNGLSAVVVEALGQGCRILRFRYDGSTDELQDELNSLCSPFLPDYSATLGKDAPRQEPCALGDEFRRSLDGERHYQTIYASGGASLISPSAGLHFSKASMIRGKLRDVRYAYINVDCGLGDRTPIDCDASLKRQSYPCEHIAIGEAAVRTINNGIASKHHVCAVGTSVLRAMETAYNLKGEARPYEGVASNFIYPGHIFGSKVDSLLTGLHFGEANPNLMAVCAFAGSRELIFDAYRKAISRGYFFGEWGDAMLIVA